MTNDALKNIADRQYGYFTSTQAVECGYSDSHHNAYYVKKGHWDKVGRGLFRLPGYEDTFESKLAHWSLWSRNQKSQPQGVISHESALFFYKLSENEPDKTHITVPTTFRKRTPKEVEIHKGNIPLSQIESKEVFMLTTPAKTLEDLKEKYKNNKNNQNSEEWNAIISRAMENNILSPSEASELGIAGVVEINQGNIAPGHENLFNPTAEDRKKLAGEQQLYIDSSGFAKQERAAKAIAAIQERMWGEGNMQNTNKKTQGGFTLVELLVVIAIISILAGMLLPVLENAKSAAQAIGCANNSKQIGIGISMYTNENDGYYPENEVTNGTYAKHIAPYLGIDEGSIQKFYNLLWWCPTHISTTANEQGPWAGYPWRSNISYGYSISLWGSSWGGTKTHKRLSQIKKPSRFLVTSEMGSGSSSDCDPDGSYHKAWPSWVSGRHENMTGDRLDGYCLTLFADTSVRSVFSVDLADTSSAYLPWDIDLNGK